MLRYNVPPGYRRAQPVRCPKLDGFTCVIDQILGDDQERSKKQCHTAKGIWERLRAEHAFSRAAFGSSKTTCAQRRRAGRTMCVPFCASAGRRPGRFRRSTGGHHGRRVQGALPRRGSPAQRRRVREGVSRRDDAGVLRRPQRRVLATSAGCRGASSTTTSSWRWRRILGDGTSPADAGLQRAPVALLVRRSLRAAGERLLTKAKWKVWSATPAATASCPSRRCASWDVLIAD